MVKKMQVPKDVSKDFDTSLNFFWVGELFLGGNFPREGFFRRGVFRGKFFVGGLFREIIFRVATFPTTPSGVSRWEREGEGAAGAGVLCLG